MNAPPAIQRLSAWPGYLLFSLTTLLWVAAALPAGPLTGAGRADDATTPLVRQGWSLVPTLLLLVVAPVGMTLTAKRQGQLMLLAATDAFLALYAGLALTFRQQLPSAFQSPTVAGHLLAGGLVLLGALSVVECRRIARGELDAPAHGLGGLRLALCLLVLVVPSWPLLVPGREIASLLAPYLYLAVSAAGARLARTGPGLAFTSSLLQLALAGHVLVTLRFTLAHEDPPVGMLGAAGQATLLLAWAVLAMAGLQVLVRVPRRGTHEPVTPAPAAAGRGAAA